MPVWIHLNPEQVGKGRERKKINIVVLLRSYPTRNIKFQKKNKKIQKNKKHTIKASFQAKIVWKWPRKRDNKNYRFVTFLPDALQKIAKK